MASAMIDVPVAIAMVVVTELRRYRRVKGMINRESRNQVALKTQKVLYKGKDELIELRGVKVTERNSIAAAELIGGTRWSKVDKDGVESEIKIKVHAKAGVRVARIGDIVAIDRKTSDVYVIKAEDFAKYISLEV